MTIKIPFIYKENWYAGLKWWEHLIVLFFRRVQLTAKDDKIIATKNWRGKTYIVAESGWESRGES